MSVYVAGPDVFFANSRELADHARAVASKNGLKALIPTDNEVAEAPKKEMSKAIFEANVAMIDAADAVVANISPFRGPSADAGTVWEIGYAYGKGKPIFAFTDDGRPYAERAKEAALDKHMIEDFDNVDNLMIAHAIQSVSSTIEEAFAAAAVVKKA